MLDLNLKKILNKTQETIEGLKNKVDALKKEARKQEEKKVVIKKKVETSQKMTVELSLTSVFKATLVILGIFLFWQFIGRIQGTVSLLIMALFVSVVVNPLVDKLEKRLKVPRGLGVIVIYILAIGIIGVALSFFISILIKEIPALIPNTIAALDKLFPGTNIGEFINQLFGELLSYLRSIEIQNIGSITPEDIKSIINFSADFTQTAWDNSLKILSSLTGGIFTTAMVLVLAFFIVTTGGSMKNFIFKIVPSKYDNYVLEKITEIQQKIGDWFHGQLILCLSIGILTYIALLILGVKYAVTLALIAGITEILPYIGPTLGGIPAILIAFNQSPWLALWVLIAYVIIQQLEGNILVPLIMRKAVGLNPVVVIFVMFVGASFPEIIHPIVGIILAIPITTIVSIFIEDYAARKNGK